MPETPTNKATGSRPRAKAGDRPLAAAADDWLAAPMWYLTVVWMICLAGGLQDLRGAATGFPLSAAGTELFWWGLLLLWPIYVVELAVHILLGGRNLRFNLLYVILPPLRLGGRDHATWSRVWLPGALWQRVDRDLIDRVEKATSGPMVGFALLVLPLLSIEFGWAHLVEQHVWLKFALESTSSVIWLAFAMELIVMASIARRKTRYLTKHWIDLAIVLLPMVQAMPALRLARLVRLGKVAKLNYLAKLSKVYRTRGMATRAFRAMLLLDSVQRLLRLNPEMRLAALEEELEDHFYEIEQIRKEMRELEARIAAERDADALADTAVAGEVAGE